MRIVIVGMGYVGSALGNALATTNEILFLDVDEAKVASFGKPRQTATLDKGKAYSFAEMIFIAVPTDYEESTHRFDTSIIDGILDELNHRKFPFPIVIKSTLPVGYTDEAHKAHPALHILYSPEFLRESRADFDITHPDRIVIGAYEEDGVWADEVLSLLRRAAINEPKTHLLTPKEAEAVKLFSNTYLALRVAFFNELDDFAIHHGLDAGDVIDAVCDDARIGHHYNNPSFGYGGYCLPKDSKQLLSGFDLVPQNLIRAIVESNATRKRYIAMKIIEEARKRSDDPLIGVYRLTMIKGSADFRDSPVDDIIKILVEQKLSILIYEPSLKGKTHRGIPTTADFAAFQNESDLIIANRMEKELEPFTEKVFTRDIFNRD